MTQPARPEPTPSTGAAQRKVIEGGYGPETRASHSDSSRTIPSADPRGVVMPP